MRPLDSLAWVFMFLVSSLWIKGIKKAAFGVAVLAALLYLAVFVWSLLGRI
jgi:hypothetical protein